MSVIQYKRGAAPNAAYAPSPGVWGDCPVAQLLSDPAVGWHYLEQWFDRTHSYASATAANGYLTYQDTGATIAGANLTETELNSASYHGIMGYLQMATANAQDNDEASIQAGNGASNLLCIDKDGGKAWFETCVRFPNITEVNFFVGLCDQGAAAADFMTNDTGVIAADEDYIGFRTLVADTDGLDAVYQTASDTEGVVKEEAQVIEASTTTTWYNLGITFDGATTVKYYVNGTFVGQVDCETSGFPDGVAMAPFWAVKASTTVEKKLDIAWWRAAQLYEG